MDSLRGKLMENPEDSEKLKQFWIERCCECNETPKFIFINPKPDGMCTMIFNLKVKEKMKVPVYYNNCRNVTPGEYVTYKLLGYLD